MVRKVIFNTLTYILGSGVAQIFSLIFVLVLMDQLSVEDYGEYTLVISLVAIFSFVIDGGLTGYIIREFSNKKYQLNQYSKARNTLICDVYFYQVIVTIFLMVTYTITVYMTVDDNVFANYLTFGLLTLLFGLATPFFAFFIADEKRYIIVAKDIFISIIRLIFIFIIFEFSFDSNIIYWVPLSALFVSIFLIFIFFRYILKGFNNFLIPSKNKVIKVFKLVSPFLMLSLFNIIYNKIDVLMLDYYSTIQEVAFYAGATIFVYPFMFICSAASSSILPYLSRNTSGENYNKDERLIFIFMLTLGGGLSSILFLVSPFLYTNLFDGKYFASAEIYEILVWYLFIVFAYTSVSNSLIAKGKIYSLIYMNVAMVVLNMLLNYWLIPDYGARGAAYSTVFSEVIILLFLYFFTKGKTINA